jgi:hypothetical protein
VDRDEQDTIGRVEDVVRAIAVVHVPVEDQHAVQPVGVERVLSGDGDRVEQAEPHRTRAGRVVAGRAVQRRSAPRLARQQRVDHRHGPAGGVQRRRPGAGRGHRVHVDHPAPGSAEALDAVDVDRVVNCLETLALDRRRLAHVPVQPGSLLQRLLDGHDAGDALGMRPRVVLARRRVAEQEGLRHAGTVPRSWRSTGTRAGSTSSSSARARPASTRR